MIRTSRRDPAEKLSEDDHAKFAAFVAAGLAQYGISRSELSKVASVKLTKQDLTYMRFGSKRRQLSGDALANKTKLQVRRVVDNAIARRCTVRTARLVTSRILKSRGAQQWRASQADGADSWFDRYQELSLAGAPYVAQMIEEEGGPQPVVAYVHPKQIDLLVEQCIGDIGSLLSRARRESVASALKESFEKRSDERVQEFVHWVHQGEQFVDVRVFEGFRIDSETGARVRTHEVIYDPLVRPYVRAELDEGERRPLCHERIAAVIALSMQETVGAGRLFNFVLDSIRLGSHRKPDRATT